MRAEIRVPVALDRAGSRGTGATMWLDTHRLGLRTRMRLALGEAVRFALAPPGGGPWIVGWCRIDATRAAEVPDAVDLTCVITRMEPEHRSRFDAWLDELAPPPPPEFDLSASAASPNPRPGRPVAITKEALKILDESDPRSSEDTDQAGGLSVGRRAIREALRRSELGRGGAASRTDPLAAKAPDPAPDADADPGWDEPTADFTDDEPTAITPLAALIEEAARQGISAEFLASERVSRMDEDSEEFSGDDASLSGDFGFELDGDALSSDLTGFNDESLAGAEYDEDPVTFDGLHSIDEEAFLAQEDALATPDLSDLGELAETGLDASDLGAPATPTPAFTLDELGPLGNLGDLADLDAPDPDQALFDGLDALGEPEALESQPSLHSAPTFDAEQDLFGGLGASPAPAPEEDIPTLLSEAEPEADDALDDLFGGLFDDGPAQDDGFSGFGDALEEPLGDTLSDRSVELIQSPPPAGAGFRLSFDEAAASQGQNVGFDLQFDEAIPDSGSTEYTPPPRPPRRPKDEAPPPPSRVDDPEDLLNVLGLSEPPPVTQSAPTPPTPPTPPPPPADAPITKPPREEPLFTHSPEKSELTARWRAQASFARDFHDQLSQKRLDVSDVLGLPAEGAFINLRFELPDGQVLALRGRRVGEVLELDIPRPALQKLKRLAETA
jgi:hypothetical protein